MGEPLVCHLDNHCLDGATRCCFYDNELTVEDCDEHCVRTSPRSFVCDLP